ncbi:MAG: replication initiation protein [Candidatus Thiodiazotropha sp. (ex Lucinoma borealis)]|nr:replication initiation protein [Candidatus Thiodiazotropha sp. (ex Lucinoma borealis)]
MIIRANYRLTLVEQRILLACIAKINPFEPVPEVITLTADEYADIYSMKVNAVYQAFKNASVVLPDRVLRIVDEHGEQEVIPWLKYTSEAGIEPEEAVYPHWEGRIYLRFSEAVKPFLSGMSKNFTQYELEKVAGLKSTHSIRLYELLISWRKTKTLYISLEDFKARLGIEGQYPRLDHLKDDVIVPAVKELGKESALSVKWTAKRRGRTVVGFEFKFRERSRRGSNVRRLVT